MATYGLQIVSPSGGWAACTGPAADAAEVAELTEGNGGGPVEGTGVAGSTAAIEGRGGGVARGGTTGFASVAGAISFSDAVGLEGDDVDFSAADAEARNSEIGFQEDFASSQARSLGLKLPSAILSRMADSEKRPANCPFR